MVEATIEGGKIFRGAKPSLKACKKPFDITEIRMLPGRRDYLRMYDSLCFEPLCIILPKYNGNCSIRVPASGFWCAQA
jgi:hypothetical protein